MKKSDLINRNKKKIELMYILFLYYPLVNRLVMIECNVLRSTSNTTSNLFYVENLTI